MTAQAGRRDYFGCLACMVLAVVGGVCFAVALVALLT